MASDDPDSAPTGGLLLAPGVRVPEGAVAVSFSRGSGPGGQNVNKVNTRAELQIDLEALRPALGDAALLRLQSLAGSRLSREGVLRLVSDRRRSQDANRAEVFERLREMIETARKAPRPRRPTAPSRASKRRRLESKRRRSDVKKMRRPGEPT